ncbi:unnamed protein product, partial [Oikopleura dioica]
LFKNRKSLSTTSEARREAQSERQGISSSSKVGSSIPGYGEKTPVMLVSWQRNCIAKNAIDARERATELMECAKIDRQLHLFVFGCAHLAFFSAGFSFKNSRDGIFR